jgi:hypothetical protein
MEQKHIEIKRLAIVLPFEIIFQRQVQINYYHIFTAYWLKNYSIYYIL